MNLFCTACGNPVESTKFCGRCGMENHAPIPPPKDYEVRSNQPGNVKALLSPPSLHWAIVLALSIITLGAFVWVWAFVQAIFIRRLTGTWKPLVWFSVGFGLLAVGFLRDQEPLMSLAGWVCFPGVFSVRRYLLRHYNSLEPINLKIRWRWTALGSIFYLQHHFTRIAHLKRDQPAMFAPYATPQLASSGADTERFFDGRYWLRFAAITVAVGILVVGIIYVSGAMSSDAAERIENSQPSPSSNPKVLDPLAKSVPDQQSVVPVQFASVEAFLDNEQQVRGKLVTVPSTISFVFDDALELERGDEYFNWRVTCQPSPEQRESIRAMEESQAVVVVGTAPIDGPITLRESSPEQVERYEVRLTGCQIKTQ